MEQLTLQQTALLNRYHRIHASWLKVETYEMDVMLCAAYASALDLCLAADFNPFDYPEQIHISTYSPCLSINLT